MASNKIRKGITGMLTNVDRRPRKTVASGGRKTSTPPRASGKNWIALEMQKNMTDNRPLWGDLRPVTKGWTPTKMGEPCGRVTILSVLGYRGDPISEGLRRIFDRGNSIETEWQTRFRNWGILIDSNIRIKTPPGKGIITVSGEYDIRVRHPYEAGRQMIGEIKSINDRGFGLLPAVTMDPEYNKTQLMQVSDRNVGPRLRKYVFQTMSYLYETGIREGFLLFDNKNTQAYADYYLELDEELVETEYTKLQKLESAWQQLVIPPCGCIEGAKKGPLCKIKVDEEIPYEEMKALAQETF